MVSTKTLHHPMGIQLKAYDMLPYKLDTTNDLLTSRAGLVRKSKISGPHRKRREPSALETVQETIDRLLRYMWKTQPPCPLSGGLSTQFPPDKGG